ncbi:MAG: rane-bound lytic murein transglycosylase [Bacteroidota bacterium]|nr:rane-bound lytic murein transglycosylase [Bacteroidota bacterium]
MSYFLKENKRWYLLIAIYFITGILVSAAPLMSQTTTKPDASKIKTAKSQLFPDKYSELDEVPSPSQTKDEFVLSTLEKSRQKYLQALILISNQDTAGAAKYFEQAIDILNVLASYPGIEQNDDFTDLVQSIVEDYESYIQDIDNLDENASAFIIREKFYQEVEIQTSMHHAKIQALPKKGDSAAAKPQSAIFSTVIPLDENEFVQKNIEFLTTNKGRRFFGKWLERSTKWFPLLKQTAADEGLPMEIIYLAMIESGLNPNAVSSAKAVGMWQFIRETGRIYGLNANSSVWIDERRDPVKATKAAMRHLKDLYNELGDWHLALAAYNCGINGVQRAIVKSKLDKPNFWDIRKYLPRETRNYVPLYIAATMIAMQPEAYGFDLKGLNYQEEFKYDEFKVSGACSLFPLSRCAGITLEELQGLNPELVKACTPPDSSQYTIKIPYGSKQTFIAKYATLTDDEKMPWIYHTVKSKETLKKIARDYGISTGELASLNGLKTYKSRLSVGAVLRVPITASQKTALAAQQKNDEEQTQAPKTSLKKKSSGKDDYIYHTVKRGENLHKIAQKYGVRIADVRNWNDIPYNRDHIDVGKKLIISKRTGSSSSIASSNSDDDTETPSNVKKINTKAKSKTITHKVKKGETLAKIADTYNSSIREISDLNKLNKGKIYVGQVLKIKTTGVSASITESEPDRAPKRGGKIIHKVKQGENLSSIAALYNVTPEQIIKWNPKDVSGNTVYAGSRLEINSEETSKGGNSSHVSSTPKYYKIRKGDTFGTISKQFGVSVTTLKSKNKGINDRNLQVGQKIRIE